MQDGRRPPRSSRFLEFHPDVVELEETPRSPTIRVATLSIFLLFGTSLTWATLGRADIIAVADGQVVPSEEVKALQPLETSVVRAILVGNGEKVQRGQALFRLDPVAADAALARVRIGWTRASVTLSGLRNLLSAPEARNAPAILFGGLGSPGDQAEVNQTVSRRRAGEREKI